MAHLPAPFLPQDAGGWAGVGTRLQGLPREPGVQGAVGPIRSKGEASEVFAPQMQNLRGNEKTQ